MPPNKTKRFARRQAGLAARLHELNANLAGKNEGERLKVIQMEAIARIDDPLVMVQDIPAELAHLGIPVDDDVLALVTSEIAHRMSNHRHDVRATVSDPRREKGQGC